MAGLVLLSSLAGMAQNNQGQPDCTDSQFLVYCLFGDLAPGGAHSGAVSLCRKAFLCASTGDDAMAKTVLDNANTVDGGRHKLLFKLFAEYIAETKNYALGGITTDDNSSVTPFSVWENVGPTLPPGEAPDFGTAENLVFALTMVNQTPGGRPATIGVGQPLPSSGPLSGIMAPEKTLYPFYQRNLKSFGDALAAAEGNHFINPAEAQFTYDQAQVIVDELENNIRAADAILGKECGWAHQAGNTQLEAELLVRRGDNLVFSNDSWRSLGVDLSIDEAYHTALAIGNGDQYRTPSPQDWAQAKSYYQQALGMEPMAEAKTNIELRLSVLGFYSKDLNSFIDHFHTAEVQAKEEGRAGFSQILNAERAMIKRNTDDYNQACDELVKLGEANSSRGLLRLTLGWAYRQQYLDGSPNESIPTAMTAEHTAIQLHDFSEYEEIAKFISDTDSINLGREDEAIVERKEDYQLLAKDWQDYKSQNPDPVFVLPPIQHDEVQEIRGIKEWLQLEYLLKYQSTGDDSWLAQIDYLQHVKDGVPLGKDPVLERRIKRAKLLAEIKGTSQTADEYWSQVVSNWDELFSSSQQNALEMQQTLGSLMITDPPSEKVCDLLKPFFEQADPCSPVESAGRPNASWPEQIAVNNLQVYSSLALGYRNYDVIHRWIDRCEANPGLKPLTPAFEYDKASALLYEGNVEQGADCLRRLETAVQDKGSRYISQIGLVWLDEYASVLSSDSKRSLLDHEKLRLMAGRQELQGMGVDPNARKSAERAMQLRNLANGTSDQNAELTETVLGEDRPLPIAFKPINYTEQDLDKVIASLPPTSTLVFYDIVPWSKRAVIWLVSGSDKSIKMSVSPEPSTLDLLALKHEEKSGRESMEQGVKLTPHDTQLVEARFADAVSSIPAGTCVGVEWNEAFPIEYLTGSDGIPFGMKYGLYRFPTLFDVNNSPQWPCQVAPQTNVSVLKGDSEFAGDEAMTIGRFFHTDVMGTKADLQSATFTPQVLHVVGHCGFNNANPYASYILLSGEPLSAWELFGRMPVMPLMVFSACDTGAKEASTNENFAWIASAGRAIWTVSTLWEVDDAGAADMMGRFYSHLHDGVAVPVALADARRDIKERYSPRVYDAFVVSSQGPILLQTK